MSAGARLVCPGCGREHPDRERFCASCGMPLVLGGSPLGSEQPAGALRRQARKIKPQYAEGALVKVAGARDQTEAEFIQSMLLEEGVPSMLRRSRGFDVSHFLAVGPRDVLVPESGAAVAREVLLQSQPTSPMPSAARGSSVDVRRRVMAWALLALLALFLLASIAMRL